MSNTFWNGLSKPIFTVAPMADVTGTVFRYMIAKYSRPSVVYNEFLSADGVSLGEKEKFIRKLKFHSREKPVVAQFFGSRPENFKVSAELARELGYDGVDINMGCPSRKVTSLKQASGIALIKNPELARDIIRSTKEGAGDLAVSVKTRIGWDEIEIDDWIPTILKEKPAALAVHLRTKKELSLVPAHWESTIINKILEMRNDISPNTVLIGNGDIDDLVEAKEKASQFHLDGIMVGRSLYGNPWFFNHDFAQTNPSIEVRCTAILEHALLMEGITPHVPLVTLNTHYSGYLNSNSTSYQVNLLKKSLRNCRNSNEIHQALNQYLSENQLEPLDYTKILNELKPVILEFNK